MIWFVPAEMVAQIKKDREEMISQPNSVYNINRISQKTIDSFRQNKVTLIVRDLTWRALSENEVYAVLLSRGVFKWFAVRRHIIKMKIRWKQMVTDSISRQHQAKQQGNWSEVHYQRGFRAALEMCRAEIREQCHSPRWNVQDNDYGAFRWLMAHQTGLKVKNGNGAPVLSNTPTVATGVKSLLEEAKSSIGPQDTSSSKAE